MVLLNKKRRPPTMKATGIVRKVDILGRIVIPINLRRDFDLKIKDDIEIFSERDTIVLKKYEPACVFCGSVDEVSEFKEKKVCAECFRDMKS